MNAGKQGTISEDLYHAQKNRKSLPRACWTELRLRLRGNRDVKRQPWSVREAEAETDFQAAVRTHRIYKINL